MFAPLSSVPAAERRKKIRLRCGIRVILRTMKASYDARVINVSGEGLCVEMDTPIKNREPVSLHRREFGSALQGRVAWCRNRGSNSAQMGIVFANDETMLNSSWLMPALDKLGYDSEGNDERRKLTRVPGRVGCTIHCFDSDVHYKGFMVDLSLGGCMVEGVWPLPVGSEARFQTAPIAGLMPLSGVGKVVGNQCLEKSPPKYRMGIEFTERNATLTRKYMKVMMSAL